MRTGIASKKLKNGRGLSREELDQVIAATQEVHNLPRWVKDMAAPSVVEVARYGRMMAAEEHINMLGIDYVQLMSNGIENKTNDVGTTSQQLRAFSLNMHVPVFACAQLSREIEKRGHDEKAPKLSDLRDSGNLEQDASMIVFPRPLWANPSENGRLHTLLKALPIKFHVVKNRNGETGVSDPVVWLKSPGNYRTLYRGPDGSFQP
jgi:replicative DNA helicase